jgi:hypothetical protein
MNLPHSAPSPRRRKLLAGLGAGLCATLAGWYGWHKARPGAASAPKQVASTFVTPAATQSPESAPPQHPAAPKVLTREWFEPYLNTEFHLKVSALTAAAMKLVEVSPARTITDNDKHVNYTSFSLVFTGPKSLPEESKVYRVEHGVLGAMDVFLSPVGKYEKEVRLEAVFTQRVV